MIKKILQSLLPAQFQERIQRLRKLIRNFKSLAVHYGQWRTIRDWDSVNSNGEPTPWYTYPATEFLSHIDLSRFKVFEYGSGNSTLWWSRRAEQVTSVEDDESWYLRVKNNIVANSEKVSYRFVKDRQQYFSMATSDFDVFIVDGKHRRECLEQIVSLGGGGVMLVLDNSDWYPKSVRFIQDKLGWMQIDFHGFGPINDYTWTTSLFINPLRHSELNYLMPLKSISGLVQVDEGDY